MKTAFLVVLLVAAVSAANTLKQYNVNTSAITTSGISSGAFFAVQMFVAYSSIFSGVGVEAGGPYYCAQGSITYAEIDCMYLPSGLIVSTLVSDTASFYKAGDIDDPSNMADHKVYMFSGTKDTVVDQGVVDKAQTYFENYMDSDRILYENSYAAEHAWITDDYGNSCSRLASPYMNNCDYDSAGVMYEWFYGTLNERGTMNSSNLFEFDQSEYVDSGTPKSISMGTTGYYYVPTACQQGEVCKLTVVFHGCEMTIDDIGSDFYENAGVNEWAETNNMIVVYPQAIASTLSPSNPEGCFDWWGYNDNYLTKGEYAKKSGAQMIAVYNMVAAIAGL